MIPYFLFRPETPSLSVVLRPDVLANLLFLGCVASMLCYLTWNWVIKKLGATIVTNYVYFNPVTTVIFAWLILSERITIYFLIGTLLILTGMYLCNRVTKTN
jgi:drug/metabolite transporter (DMT)-like permease